MRRIAGPGLWAGALALLAGCGEEDLASVRLVVRGDGAGQILVSRVTLGELPGELARASDGIAWESDSAAVELAGASFDDIDGVRLAGLRFRLEDRTRTFVFTARIPAGESARWPGLLSPVEDKKKLKKLAARAKELPDIGSAPVYKFQVELPGGVVKQSLSPKMAEEGGFLSFGGVQTGARGRTAYLVLPLEEVRKLDEPEIVWTVEAR